MCACVCLCRGEAEVQINSELITTNKNTEPVNLYIYSMNIVGMIFTLDGQKHNRYISHMH